MLCFIVRL